MAFISILLILYFAIFFPVSANTPVEVYNQTQLQINDDDFTLKLVNVSSVTSNFVTKSQKSLFFPPNKIIEEECENCINDQV